MGQHVGIEYLMREPLDHGFTLMRYIYKVHILIWARSAVFKLGHRNFDVVLTKILSLVKYCVAHGQIANSK